MGNTQVGIHGHVSSFSSSDGKITLHDSHDYEVNVVLNFMVTHVNDSL